MQIIEVTDFGVRSAVIRLKRRATPLQFVLYPMIHVAEPTFFAAVADRLKRADIVVVEGVGRSRAGGSVLVNALTFSYSVLRYNRRSPLVVDQIDYAALGVELVRPDVDAAQFKAGWRRIPLADRAAVWLALPFVVLVRLFGGTRALWTSSMEQNDLPTPQDEALADRYPELERALGGERDDRLLAALRRLHEEHGGEAVEVAVVYGAAHMPAVVYGLMRLGYRPRSGDWLTVVDFP